MSSSPLAELAESIYALAKTNGMFALIPNTRQVRPLTEVEWRYLHKQGNPLREGIDKAEYASYMRRASMHEGTLLTESLCEDTQRWGREILVEAKSEMRSAKREKNGVFHFYHELTQKIRDIIE